jgi:phosphoribosyl-AMP cyclohydrolase
MRYNIADSEDEIMTKDKDTGCQDLIAKLKFDDRGLIPAIAQDADNGQVLMMAWMNAVSVGLTLEPRLCHYWSRSRRELWKKGATSGHLQHVQWIKYDCDSDCLLIGIVQDGAACHTGERSCFFRDLEKD